MMKALSRVVRAIAKRLYLLEQKQAAQEAESKNAAAKDLIGMPPPGCMSADDMLTALIKHISGRELRGNLEYRDGVLVDDPDSPEFRIDQEYTPCCIVQRQLCRAALVLDGRRKIHDAFANERITPHTEVGPVPVNIWWRGGRLSLHGFGFLDMADGRSLPWGCYTQDVKAWLATMPGMVGQNHALDRIAAIMNLYRALKVPGRTDDKVKEMVVTEMGHITKREWENAIGQVKRHDRIARRGRPAFSDVPKEQQG